MAQLGDGSFQEGRMWLVRLPPRVKTMLESAKRGEEIGVLSEAAQPQPGGATTLRLKVARDDDVAEYDLVSNDAHAEVSAFVLGDLQAKEEGAEEPARKSRRLENRLYNGRVVGKPAGSFSLKPVAGIGYRRVCRGRLLSSYESSRVVQEVDPADLPTKTASDPISLFRERAERREAAGEAELEAPKKPTINKKELKARLFKVFATAKEPLSMRDVRDQLVEADPKSPQPDGFIRECLTEVCTTQRGKHGKFYFDLKAEYKNHA